MVGSVLSPVPCTQDAAFFSARWQVTRLLQREQGPQEEEEDEPNCDGTAEGRRGRRRWVRLQTLCRQEQRPERGRRQKVRECFWAWWSWNNPAPCRTLVRSSCLPRGHWALLWLRVGHCCHRNAPRSTGKQNSGAVWSGETNNIWLLFLICIAAVSYSPREARYQSTPLRQRKKFLLL